MVDAFEMANVPLDET